MRQAMTEDERFDTRHEYHKTAECQECGETYFDYELREGLCWICFTEAHYEEEPEDWSV